MKGDEAVRRIRNLIASGKVTPGEHLRQDIIAAQIGMTRVPVREAFKSLVAEGILVHKRNQGHFVVGRSSAELSQISWMRDNCENRLAETATLPDAEKFAGLERLNEAFRNTGATIPYDLLEADRDFHRGFWSLSPLSLIAQETERMWRMLGPYWQLMDFTETAIDRMYAEHLQILEALRAGNHNDFMVAVEEHHCYLREILGHLAEEEMAAIPD